MEFTLFNELIELTMVSASRLNGKMALEQKAAINRSSNILEFWTNSSWK